MSCPDSNCKSTVCSAIKQSAPILITLASFAYMYYYNNKKPESGCCKDQSNNTSCCKYNTIKYKEGTKAVDFVDIDEVKQSLIDQNKNKVSYCRCWKSETFPLCDGAHNKHNEATGDNLAPLVLQVQEKK